MPPKKRKQLRQSWVQRNPLGIVAEDDVVHHVFDARHGSADDDSEDYDYDVNGGDSLCSSEGSSTAVAAETNGAPLTSLEVRGPRDTRPEERQPQVEGSARPKRTSRFTPKESNVGWFFANWGQFPAKGFKRERIDIVLKKQPATIIGLSECDAITDAYLRQKVCKGDPQSRVNVNDPMKERDACEYLTLRGNEEHSVLIGVRVGPGTELKLLFWDRRGEGLKTTKSGKKFRIYSRCMIARVTLEHSAGALGYEHVVMVNHVHNTIANLGVNSKKLQATLTWLANNIKTHKVQVIMGDYNMACFNAVPFFRSCGIVVDVGAWYPFKSLQGVPMSDSCVILFVNLPGEYRLHHGLDCLHAGDETGLFHKSRSAVAGRHNDARYDRIEEQAGPGMLLRTYQPKGNDVTNWETKIRPFLTPSSESAEVVQRYTYQKAQQDRNFTRDSVAPNFLRMKEKRLDLNKFFVGGTNVGGSHFPLCVFTNNPGRRSENKTYERSLKSKERRSPGADGLQLRVIGRDVEDVQARAWPATSSSSTSSTWCGSGWACTYDTWFAHGNHHTVWSHTQHQDDDERRSGGAHG